MSNLLRGLHTETFVLNLREPMRRRRRSPATR